MVILLILIIICLFGWGYKLYNEIEKIKKIIGINPVKVEEKEEKINDEKDEGYFIHKIYNYNPYKIRVKIIRDFGDNYLVKYIESYPKFMFDSHNPFRNGRYLISKSELK